MKKQEEITVVPRRVRGSLLVKGQDCYEFSPYNEGGESTQQVLKTSGKSKLYKTVGERQQKMIAHLAIDPDCPDPRAELTELVERLTSDMPTAAKPKLRGKVLTMSNSLRVTLNQKERKLEVVMSIDLNETPNYNDRLMKLMYETSQCFAINQTSLAKLK